MERTPRLCASCQDAIAQEASGFGFRTDEEFAGIAAEFGSEIPDHNCEAAENQYGFGWNQGNVLCSCGCPAARESRERFASSSNANGTTRTAKGI